MRYALIETDIGFMGLGWTGRGVARFMLPGRDRAALAGAFAKAGAQPGTADAELVARIKAYAAGDPVEFNATPLDLDGVSEFNRSVYAEIEGLHWGETTTYGDIARLLGDVGLSRAVGRALGQNPSPLLIPCHRVLGSNGMAGGFSAPGGVSAKMRMLALERAASPTGQFSFGF